ncbi:MAG TPA: hypothetical protein DCL41_05930 [Bdellovibrionales bacterium]|nr:hypothetical protein [Pseudobdellovibrionaceae bacterium]HAG91389.1 hypothetical protein [Bdellovibrionales bacterium]|tara:strand:+ start:18905 stop:19834 length:930 start_codon:yes stop_codon:yes gene_type:complete
MPILIACLTLFSSFVFCSPNAEAKIKARRAVVSIDGAAVYAKPDFDSEVITYLSVQEPVIASVKTFSGRGGLGLFFAVKAKGGVKGFIADTDLVDASSRKPISPLLKEKETAPLALPPKEEKPNTIEHSIPEDLGSDGFGAEEPLYFRRHLGGVVGRRNYNIQYQGSTYLSDLTFFGFRSTGPGTLFDGPPLDFNLAVSLDSPSYYTEFAQNKPSGFLIFSDLGLQLPFWEDPKQIVYYSLGLEVTYSRYKVQINDQFTDTSEFRFGGELGLGYGHKLFGKDLIRLDYKYHFGKFQNRSYWLSYLVEYP